MKFDVGDWVYCKTKLFPNGTIIEEKKNKYLIETWFSILELTSEQVEENFTKDLNQ